MATFSMTDCTAWFHNHDFTSDSNKLTIKAEADDLDKTVFGNTYRSRIGGLQDVSASLEGFWQSDTDDEVDPVVFTNLGAQDKVMTVAPTSAEESVAYFFKAGAFSYEFGGNIGEVIPFAADAMGTNGVGLVKGQVAAAVQSVSATGAFGTGVQVGATTTTMYAALHVFTAGTTLTVSVESDDNSGFSSATTVGSFAAITAVGSYWLAVDGANADDYYRFNVTDDTGTFSVAGAIGVR